MHHRPLYLIFAMEAAGVIVTSVRWFRNVRISCAHTHGLINRSID